MSFSSVFVSAILIISSAKHANLSSMYRDYNTSFEPRPMTEVMKKVEEATILCILDGTCPVHKASIINSPKECIDGLSDDWYPCSNIDMLSFISLDDLSEETASNVLGNDVWGWQNPENGRLYAISGQTNGASLIDVTDPQNPVVLVFIPSTLSHNVNWRDIKVSTDGWVYIVADGSNHGIQYANLRELIQKGEDNIGNGIYRAVYAIDYGIDRQVGNVHNIVINEDTNYLYVVGSTQSGNSQNSRGGLVAYDVGIAKDISADNLQIVGVFPNDGYTHDAQCVIYDGPDTVYVGREICFCFNENSLTIVDVSIKTNMQQISRTTYGTSRYTHQGWLTPKMEYILLNDELDENAGTVSATTTYIFDVKSLSLPILSGIYSGPTTSIDHNLYITSDGIVYESNYRAGLRILTTEKINQQPSEIEEIAYFDMYVLDKNPVFGHGVWSCYVDFMEDPDTQKNFIFCQTKAQGFFVLDPSKIVYKHRNKINKNIN